MAHPAIPRRKPALICSARLNLALVMFLGCVVLYALRGNISFALVCMVRPDQDPTNGAAIIDIPKKCDSKSEFLALFQSTDTSPANKIQLGEFSWSKRIQGTILSAFFFGYMTSQVLGGYLAQRIGAKRVIFVSLLLCSSLTLVNPLAARYDVTLLITIRAVLGFLQGVVFPAMHSMWALWSPPLERGLLTGLSYAGAQVGNVLVMPISGVLCRHGFAGGWPSIFYVLGVLGVLWCVIWWFIVADTPQKHPRINSDERHYILHSLKAIDDDNDDEKSDRVVKVVKLKLPLRAIFTSPAVWACFIGHFAGDWGAYTMATGLPLFMNDALGLDPAAMGILSSLPYIAYFIMINVGGVIADRLQRNDTLSTLNTRRLAMIVALGGQAFFLLLIGNLRCGQEFWLIVLLTLSLGISGLQYSGFIVNYLDICPAFAGTVVGVGQTISCLGGIISPLAIGFLTPMNSREEWQHVFYLTAAVLIGGALIFCAFARGDVQPWADPLANEVQDDGERQNGTHYRNNLASALNTPLLEDHAAKSGIVKNN